MTDLSVDLGFLKLRNPVLAASGTFGYGLEFEPYLELEKLGGFVVKGLYFEPREGNPPPRLVETPSGLLNAIGLQGDRRPGLRREGPAAAQPRRGTADHRQRLRRRRRGIPRPSSSSSTREEGIAAYELNISCPNVREGRAVPRALPRAARTTLVKRPRRSRGARSSPSSRRTSPTSSTIAQAAEEGGPDAVALVNTLPGHGRRRRDAAAEARQRFGGLSGPAIQPLALRMVHQVASRAQDPGHRHGRHHDGRATPSSS